MGFIVDIDNIILLINFINKSLIAFLINIILILKFIKFKDNNNKAAFNNLIIKFKINMKDFLLIRYLINLNISRKL